SRGPNMQNDAPAGWGWKAGAALLVAALLTAGLVGAAWRAWVRPRPAALARDGGPSRSPFPADPRLTYEGPFNNIHPDVAYVGDEKCVGCHKEVHDAYRNHPMGRSLVPVARAGGPSAEGHNNPFDALGNRLSVEVNEERVFHRQTRLGEDGNPV